MAKVYNWTAPPPAVTDLAVASIGAGGSLGVDTFYYVVVAIIGTTHYVWDKPSSGISNEVTATTDAANQTVNLTWSAVPGATAYCVFRYTSSDGYGANNNTRIRNAANSGYYPTTENTTFSDDGTRSMYSPNLVGVTPANQLMPVGLDPRTNGYGILTVTGGTHVDPITFADIYAEALSVGYDAHFSWDGVVFGSCCFFNMSGSIETHLIETANKVWIHLGSVDLKNSNANSETIFGTLNADTSTEDGVKCIWLGGADRSMEINSPTVYFYDVGVSGSYPPYSSLNLYGDGAFQLYNIGAFSGTKITNFSYCNIRGDVPLKEFESIGPTYYSPVYNYWYKTVSVRINSKIYSGYGYNIDRFDGLTSLRSIDHVFVKNVTQHFVDPKFQQTDEGNGLPELYHLSPYTGAYNQYWSFLIKAIDEDGNPISSAKLTIKDKNGNVIKDFDGATNLEDLEADSEGYFWLEKINVTSATTTTIEDTSKSWTIDEWIGRNVYISSGDAKEMKGKVLSNTATVLTLVFPIATAPSNGDKVGIIPELKTASGAYGGATRTTDWTEYFPFEFGFEATGYKTYKMKVSPDRPIDWVIKLYPQVPVIIHKKGTAVNLAADNPDNMIYD